MLSHRDRVLMSLDHRQPDRLPIDLGGTQTSLLVEPYDALKKLLGMNSPTTIDNMVMGLAHIEDEVLERLDIDFRHVLPGQADKYQFQLLPDDSFYDEFGTRWRRPPGGYYYDMVEFPLASCSLEDLGKYKWPDPYDAGRIRGARERLVQLRKTTDFALEAGLFGLWETCWFTVGLERWLLACVDNPDFVETLLDSVLAFLMDMHGAYLDETGAYLDLVTLWDDYGIQSSTIISPVLWRKLVKPRLARLVAMIRSKTNAYIGIHSCGSIASILDDLWEIGIQVINPCQVSAKNMDISVLAQKYKGRLSFWGGIDTQFLLPKATPLEVQKAVTSTLDIFSRNGGYILSAVHNIQPGVPAENILAMYDTARSATIN